MLFLKTCIQDDLNDLQYCSNIRVGSTVVPGTIVLGSLPASGMKDIQIQISDDRHRRHAANLATKTQPIFRSHTRWLLFPERKRLCEIENGGFSICNFSFSISHKSRPKRQKKNWKGRENKLWVGFVDPTDTHNTYQQLCLF